MELFVEVCPLTFLERVYSSKGPKMFGHRNAVDNKRHWPIARVQTVLVHRDAVLEYRVYIRRQTFSPVFDNKNNLPILGRWFSSQGLICVGAYSQGCCLRVQSVHKAPNILLSQYNPLLSLVLTFAVHLWCILWYVWFSVLEYRVYVRHQTFSCPLQPSTIYGVSLC